MLDALICSSHTISGTMPGGPVAARHSFRDRVESCAAAGYTGMCLHLRDYAEQRAAGRSDSELASILRDHGMVDNSLEFLTGWDDGAGQSAMSEDTAWAAAEGLGITVLNAGSGWGRPDPARDKATFAALCDRAARHGVSLALEVVPWSRTPDLNTARAMVSGIGNAGLVIDCWHIFRGGISLADVAALPGGLILSVQINDALADPGPDLFADTLRRRLCGEGVFDLAGFVAAIRATGTSCPFAVEVISPGLAAMDVGVAARLSAGTARNVLQKAGDRLSGLR